MTRSHKVAVVLAAVLAGASVAVYYLRAQTLNATQAKSASTTDMNRNLVVLDPAHGGQDAGAMLGNGVKEKDVTLAIAMRLRATLTAAGFIVVSTREADSATPPTYDQRAEIANHAHALACIVLHATASGSGVHLYTSALQPPEQDAEQSDVFDLPHRYVPMPWETAQAASVSQSLHLEDDLTAALGKANLATVNGHESVRPLDNMQCPAVAIELAPLPVAGGNASPVTDTNYQQRVSSALTAALQVWRGHVDATATAPSATAAPMSKAMIAHQTALALTAAKAAQAAAEAAGRAAAKRAATRAAAAKLQAASGQTGETDRPDDAKPTSKEKAATSSTPGDVTTDRIQTGGRQ